MPDRWWHGGGAVLSAANQDLKVKATFVGRKLGALGFSGLNTVLLSYVEGETREATILRLYETHEHISHDSVRLIEPVDCCF